MPNPYPTALRERAVRAYEGGVETYADVATRFSIDINTLVRWALHRGWHAARGVGESEEFSAAGRGPAVIGRP